ncbi:substrate-binding domain-containing protein [Candidatus Poriferisodalis sp.]|uniref:substrate-binding domain-containing protein n=1 Tax=Candidatus Poriferisodalis sp. TaxID=3101277 RepID=UPI003B51A072
MTPTKATKAKRPHPVRTLTAVLALALVVGACASGDSDEQEAASSTTAAPEADESQPTPTQAPATTVTTTTPAPSEPPHVAPLAWGNFVLSPRIADKLSNGDDLNFVISLTSTGPAGGAAPFEAGWFQAGADVAAAHGVGIDARVVGPYTADAEAQAETIEALIASGDIDCLAVEASAPGVMRPIIGTAVDAGIPTYTVGGDSPESKRFAFYGSDDFASGEMAGSLVGKWALDGGILVRRAGLQAGDGGDRRSVERMRGFVAGLVQTHSSVEWVNDPTTVVSQGFESVAVYDASEAWVLDNIDVDIVFHPDSGLETVAKVIADRLLYGDMYAVGFHMNEAVADYIRQRVVVAAMIPGNAEQARQAGTACGGFLLAGEHQTATFIVDPVAVTRDNVDEIDWTQSENR